MLSSKDKQAIVEWLDEHAETLSAVQGWSDQMITAECRNDLTLDPAEDSGVLAIVGDYIETHDFTPQYTR